MHSSDTHQQSTASAPSNARAPYLNVTPEDIGINGHLLPTASRGIPTYRAIFVAATLRYRTLPLCVS